MSKTTRQPARNQQEDPRELEGVQRLELLSWRFSEAEIQSLSRLQLLHRRQPDVLDMPLEECRLRFARWQVEHGYLSEGIESDPEEQLWPEGVADVLPDLGDLIATADGMLSGNQEGELVSANAQGKEPERIHVRLRGAWSGIRRGMARVVKFTRGLGGPNYHYPPGYPMDRKGAWGPCNPYGAYDGPRPITDDPWFWTRL